MDLAGTVGGAEGEASRLAGPVGRCWNSRGIFVGVRDGGKGEPDGEVVSALCSGRGTTLADGEPTIVGKLALSCSLETLLIEACTLVGVAELVSACASSEVRESTLCIVVAGKGETWNGGSCVGLAASVEVASAELNVLVRNVSYPYQRCQADLMLTLPRLRAPKLEAFLWGRDDLRPNSSVTSKSGSRGELSVEAEDSDANVGPGDGKDLSLSRLAELGRRKLRPKIDFRPLFSSAILASSPSSTEADDWVLCLREKKGMPEGVLRGLSKLDLDRPGLVATTAGVEA